MNSLEILDIGYCFSLTNISSNLFRLTKLKELNLSNNPLLFKNKDFISCLVYSEDKTSTENKGNDLPQFELYKFLKKLFICDNGLSAFPKFFCNFINLEQLDISNNLFEEIPYEIHSFANLEILNISYNHMEKMIIENGMFNNLVELYLEYNRITELSISENTLQNLKLLDLSYNRFSKLDRNILTSVKRFKESIFTGNVFTEIEKFPCERYDPISLKLTLKNMNVLPNIFFYNCINELTVTCTERIDREIDIFEHVPTNSQIKCLNLPNCFLTSIPRGISKLINLETFKAELNQISILENVFTNITSLKVLDLSFNQISTIERSIFDITTLKTLDLFSNNIELLHSTINNMRNRNLQIDLFENPLRLRLNEDPDNPELIFLEDVNQDILENIIHDGIITSRVTNIRKRREYMNMDLDVKTYYDGLNIPVDERLNLEEIKLCQVVEPGNHIKNKEQTEKILRNIFREIDICDKEEKMNFLIRRMNDYYFQDRNIIKTENPTKEYKKRNSIIDYFESIIDEIDIMLTENKKEYVGKIMDGIIFGLNFELDDNNDKNVKCLDEQGQIYISTYLDIIPETGSTNAKEKIRGIITKLKDDIIRKITAPRNEEEEMEIFIKWKHILSEELGFQKETNLYAYLDKSDRTELYDKKYIIEKFFKKFTFQTIKDEINKHLKIKRLGNELYLYLNEYITYIYGRNEEFSKTFEIIYDEKFFQLQDEDVRKLLKSMGYLCIKKNKGDKMKRLGFKLKKYKKYYDFCKIRQRFGNMFAPWF